MEREGFRPWSEVCLFTISIRSSSVRLLLLSGIHLADPCVPAVLGLYEMNDIVYRAVLGTVAATRLSTGSTTIPHELHPARPHIGQARVF